MLKRNGEDCEYPVPNYPGLLTASEHKAYTEAAALVAGNLRQFNERADALHDLEQQLPHIAEQATVQIARHTQSIAMKGALEDAWQIHHVLLKSARSESLLGSRDTAQGKEFGIIEKFDPYSAYARAHGSAELQMTGRNAFLLLQNFVASERGVLQLFRKDIEATVEESLSEKFPGQNHSRVVRAISARCGNQVAVEGEKEKQSRSVKIRM
jgi:isochorismate hydrolase